MQTNSLLFLFVSLLIISLPACNNAPSTEQDQVSEEVAVEPETPASFELPEVQVPEGYTSFTSREDGFGLAYPTDWEMQENFDRTRMLAKSPLESPQDFQENFNVIVMPLAGTGVSKLDDFIGQTERDLAGLIENFSLKQSDRISWSGKPTHQFIYTGTQGMYPDTLLWQQRIVLNSRNAYIFSWTGLADNPEKFNSEVNKILGSFVIAD